MYLKEEKFIKKIAIMAYNKIIKKHSYNVMDKGESDVVTTLDLATEKFIIANIKQNFPNDNIVSEEYNAKAKPKDRTWIIDPIDGTVNFAKNLNNWCIQMAFVDKGETQLAIIYIPYSKELYFASDKGAWCNKKRIKTNSDVKIYQAVIVHGLPKRDYQILKNIAFDVLNEFSDKVRRLRNYGTAGIEYALLACGKIDGEIIWADNPWDILPGRFICEKAGGVAYETIIKNKKINAMFANKKLCDLFDKIVKKYNK